jgi:hypothetical protein
MDADEFFGTKAGRVWHSIKSGSRTLTQIQKSTGMTASEVSMGLGWLAREGKIRPLNAGSVKARYELTEQG